MVRSIFFFAQWLIARRRTWLRILTWITRFGYWLFILYGLLEWFRPRPIAEQIKRRKTLVYCLFSVILGSSISWVIGKIWHRPRPFACGDAAALVPHKANASFPSNHSMNSLAISLMLLARRNPWGLPASVSTWHSTRNISTRASTSPTAVSSSMTSSLTRLNASSARKAKLNRMSCKKGIAFFCAIW